MSANFFDQLLRWTATGLEMTGTGIILLGAILATITFLRAAISHQAMPESFQKYRVNLGRAILLGLEFLVAADIVGTVAIEPTFQNLGVLALIVAVRTALSFALEVEVNGHWPWRASRSQPQETPDPSARRADNPIGR